MAERLPLAGDPLDRGFAPAKVNLALHVTGRGADGYHALDSLVAFAGVGDQLAALPTTGELSLALSGPFAAGLPGGEGNIVLRAAARLREARGVTRGAAIRLVKALPHAAGLGGGSSDAAAALRLLAQLWGVDPLTAEEALPLGADVPVCLHAPRPARMRGRGEALDGLDLPACGLLLVNPGVPVATAAVFAGLGRRDNPPLPPLPAGRLTPETLAAWLGGTRNDLEAPAVALAPPVAEALAALRRAPQALHVAMSGSGATCYALFRDVAGARGAARAIQLAHPRWWVAPAPLLAVPEPSRLAPPRAAE